MFDGNWRAPIDKGIKPVGTFLGHIGVSPDFLTVVGLMLGVACGVAVANGRLGLGLGLLAVSALPDLLDGAVARAHGRASKRGAFFDSVIDRVTDTFMLGGIAWYLIDRDGGHVGMLPFALLGVSVIVPYERAKAESLGYYAKGGMMERAERVIFLGIGLAFSVALVPILWAMLALTTITADLVARQELARQTPTNDRR